jgi:high affinity Mn2+ porin
MDPDGGYRLWRGAEFHVDVLMLHGFGVNGTIGIDSFPNGEAYKVGTQVPHADIARFFIRQTIGLGGEKENLLDGQQTLGGT